MKVVETKLEGVLIIEPTRHGDERGFFAETWNRKRYADAGIDVDFMQDNLSLSGMGVLRGLHFQVAPKAQGKLVSVVSGSVFDVAVDLRPESATFGEWVGVDLSSGNLRQMYIPPGFAHGFVTTSEQALFSYKCTEFYSPHHEHSVRWDDPDVGIVWPIRKPVLSVKDANAPPLAAALPRGGQVR